ncbi:MAG: PEP-CTERM sorting domain-containing protein [Gammaproteobacteria bacterium]|nr:PEP-CTERM sorting domain-containing protein [Gammaproteobacteria bacterium]NNF62299.1 PEP-CTERM sorting domain-containing protein [Gammaproteobacteria bacterium]NNM21252.1 PEP-CTERM sorting domain-containing protein [Gammaproteobacteria bacterium]
MIAKKFAASILVAVAGLLPAASLAVPFAYAIQESTQNLVTINLATGAIAVIGATGGDDIDGLALDSSGVLYGSDNDTDSLVIINRNTGAISSTIALSQGISDSGLAFDSLDQLYLADDANSELFTVDTSDGTMGLIGSNSGDISAIAFNLSDVLYGVDPVSDSLVTYNLGDGSITAVGAGLGVDIVDEQGLTFDLIGGLLYMIDEASESLYSIDPLTGLASFIANLGGDYEALAFFEDRQAAPEPGVLLLLGIGLLALTLVHRRRRNHW